MDILLDIEPISPTYGDAIFHNGPLSRQYTTQPFTETVQQRLYIRLRTFQGEYFLNTEYGVPWFTQILGKKTTKSRIDQLLQEQILLEDGVAEILSFSSTFVNRQYSLNFTARCRNGETLSLTLNNLGA